MFSYEQIQIRIGIRNGDAHLQHSPTAQLPAQHSSVRQLNRHLF